MSGTPQGFYTNNSGSESVIDKDYSWLNGVFLVGNKSNFYKPFENSQKMKKEGKDIFK